LIDAKWSKDHESAIGASYHILPVAYVRLDNQRQGGTLRWKAKDRRFGRSVGVIWKAGASKVVAPPVSIKD
jgi:hypothetical protein